MSKNIDVGRHHESYLPYVIDNPDLQKLSDRWNVQIRYFLQSDVLSLLTYVAYKGARAIEWCRDASTLTNKNWRYLKGKYGEYVALTNKFNERPAKHFAELLGMLGFVL